MWFEMLPFPFWQEAEKLLEEVDTLVCQIDEATLGAQKYFCNEQSKEEFLKEVFQSLSDFMQQFKKACKVCEGFFLISLLLFGSRITLQGFTSSYQCVYKRRIHFSWAVFTGALRDGASTDGHCIRHTLACWPWVDRAHKQLFIRKPHPSKGRRWETDQILELLCFIVPVAS